MGWNQCDYSSEGQRGALNCVRRPRNLCVTNSTENCKEKLLRNNYCPEILFFVFLRSD
jgi:hypothetical protein